MAKMWQWQISAIFQAMRGARVRIRGKGLEMGNHDFHISIIGGQDGSDAISFSPLTGGMNN